MMESKLKIFPTNLETSGRVQGVVCAEPDASEMDLRDCGVNRAPETPSAWGPGVKGGAADALMR